jgi:acetoin:2,6-dichlorophenolindophenol oxidoreductase subunit alpha
MARDTALKLHGEMVFIRRYLEKIDSLYRQGMVRGPAHLGLGQEAIAVGAASVLKPGDQSIGTYRGHAHALARGTDPESLMREMLGRSGGLCAGKGGSMHITSVKDGFYGSYAIVGAHLPVACGLAWANKIKKNDSVAVCFFGDGTVNIGAFHEAVNLAAVWKLPVIFVCENNQYMEYTHISKVIPVERPAADRASAYGLPRILVDGNDVAAVHHVMAQAVDLARRGGGPSLIEADTYRLKGHSALDPAGYRPADEVARWKEKDPLTNHAAVLRDLGVKDAALKEIDAAELAKIEALTQRALDASPPKAEEAWSDVWADGSWQWRN